MVRNRRKGRISSRSTMNQPSTTAASHISSGSASATISDEVIGALGVEVRRTSPAMPSSVRIDFMRSSAPRCVSW